jgi:hypothetical protein
MARASCNGGLQNLRREAVASGPPKTSLKKGLRTERLCILPKVFAAEYGERSFGLFFQGSALPIFLVPAAKHEANLRLAVRPAGVLRSERDWPPGLRAFGISPTPAPQVVITIAQ